MHEISDTNLQMFVWPLFDHANKCRVYRGCRNVHVFLLAFRKKVEKMAKEKGCDLIGDWKKSSLTSTSDWKGEMTGHQ